MRALDFVVMGLAIVGLAAWRGLLPSWPFQPAAGLLLLLPAAAVLLARVRQARARRTRRYGLGW